jgi:hypothetical protein
MEILKRLLTLIVISTVTNGVSTLSAFALPSRNLLRQSLKEAQSKPSVFRSKTGDLPANLE